MLTSAQVGEALERMYVQRLAAGSTELIRVY